MWDGKNSTIVVHLNTPNTILVHLALMTLCLTTSCMVYMVTTTPILPKMTFLSWHPHHPWWPSYQPCHIAGEANSWYLQSVGVAVILITCTIDLWGSYSVLQLRDIGGARSALYLQERWSSSPSRVPNLVITDWINDLIHSEDQKLARTIPFF